jgi:hypothetical protein
MAKELKFTCVVCGEHELECIMDDGSSSVVTVINDDGCFEYDNDASDADLDFYQCNHCGAHVVSDDGLDIQNDEEVVEYIKDNCKQSEGYIDHRYTDDNADKFENE